MKRKIALLLTGIMTAAALAGCSGGDPTGGSADTQKEAEKDAEDKGGEKASGDGVTLTLYCNADDLAKPYMQKIISMWEESSGNKIDQQGLDTDNAETIALTKFTTGDIPDLYVHGKPHWYSETYGSGYAGFKLWC